MNDMIVIGITGGVGAGKTAVLDYLEQHWSARTIRLDDLSRQLLEPGGSCVEGAVELLGEDIVKEDGSLDRAKIASKVFADERLRLGLNALIHPAVKSMVIRLLEEECRKGCPLFVMEAALLIEEHYDAFCDEMWYIYADEATRYRRLKESRGYDDARIRSTMNSQQSPESFRAHTDFTVDNSGDFDITAKQIDSRMKWLKAHSARRSRDAEAFRQGEL